MHISSLIQAVCDHFLLRSILRSFSYSINSSFGFLGKEEREKGWTKRGKSAGRGWATKVRERVCVWETKMRERWEERLSQ